MDFYFGLVCASLLSLANARTTAVIPTAYPEFDNCGFNLNATCDDHMELFADGNLLATSDDWKNTSAVYIPPNTGEIEIHCTDRWILGGILASSDNGLITNNAWNCSSDNRTTWNPAHELGANGVTAGNISSAAMWIWTDRPTWKHTIAQRHTTAICTIKLPTNSVCGTPTTTPTTTTACNRCVPCLFSGTTPPPTQSPTPTPGFNLNATCNNKMELFVDGNLLATSDNWRDTSQVHIPGNTENIEIHCTDSCWLIEGILASSDNGLITDNSWNCSSDNGITWSPAYEIVPNGLSVPDISPNAKWISTGQNTWKDEGKVICKVTLDIQPELTTPMPTDCLYTDKYVECPKFKNQCKSGNFVECMNRDCAKTCKCHWSPWSPWSACSATCGIAVKSRKRTCLQHPCPPGRTEEAISCHLPSCGPYIQQKCFLENSNITFLDLGHNHMHQELQPVWKIADNGHSLTETLNTRPSIGLSNLGDITEPVSFSGRVFSASGDNDVIGMVFGFWNEANFFVIASARQRPGPTNWYVARLHATCGLSCASTTTISDAIWDPPSHPKDITVLATGNTPWQRGNEYNFTVCFNPLELLLSVTVTNENEEGSILESGIISAKTNDSEVDEVSRKGGFVGVYVDSQAQTTWDYLVCQDCHLIDPPPFKGTTTTTIEAATTTTATSTTTIATITNSCPTGWTSLKTGCYRFVSGNFKTANSICKRERGYLVEINDQEEQDTLKQFYKDSGIKNLVYLGATDQHREGDWKWIQSGQKVGFTAWAGSEPNGGSKENCVVAVWSRDFKWADIHCHGNWEALCEYEELIPIHVDNQYSYYKVPMVAGSTINSSVIKQTCELRGMAPQCYSRRYNDSNCLMEPNGSSPSYDLAEIICGANQRLPIRCPLLNNTFWYMHGWRSGAAWGVNEGKFDDGKNIKITSDNQYFAACLSPTGEGVLSLSSQYVNSKNQDFTALKCLDGDLYTMCHTTNEKYPYVMMEYPNEVLVKKVRVVARAGKEANRVKQLVVSVTNVKPTRGQLVSGGKTLGTFAGPASPSQEIMFKSEAGLRGKYVVIQQGYTGIINYAEIEITKETPGQRQQQRRIPGKRRQSSPKLTEQESLNIFKKQSERRSSIKQSLPEQLELDTSNEEQGDSKLLSLPVQTGKRLRFQLKGKIGIEKVKISVDDTEEEFDLTTKWRLFSYPRPTSGSFSVEFLNDIGYTDVFIRGHESQVTDLLPNFPANKFLGCGTKNEDEKCGILRKGTLMWNGKYTYTLKG